MENEQTNIQALSCFEPKEWTKQRQEALQKIEEKYKELINKSESNWYQINFGKNLTGNWQSLITEYIIPMLECVQADEKPISFIIDLIEKQNKDVESFLQEGKKLTDLIDDIKRFLEDSRSKADGTVNSLHVLEQKREQEMLGKYDQLLAQQEETKNRLTDITRRVEQQNKNIEDASLRIQNVSEQHSKSLAEHTSQLRQVICQTGLLSSRLNIVEHTDNHLQEEISAIKKELDTKAQEIETKKEMERLATQLHAQHRRMNLLFWILLLLIVGSFLFLWLA